MYVATNFIMLIAIMLVESLLTGCGGSSSKSSGDGDLASGQEGTSNQDKKNHITSTLQI
jgi:major membrane immunogen (membrane-anchored lipoprotein)